MRSDQQIRLTGRFPILAAIQGSCSPYARPQPTSQSKSPIVPNRLHPNLPFRNAKNNNDIERFRPLPHHRLDCSPKRLNHRCLERLHARARFSTSLSIRSPIAIDADTRGMLDSSVGLSTACAGESAQVAAHDENRGMHAKSPPWNGWGLLSALPAHGP